jgi:hypothetical protein
VSTALTITNNVPLSITETRRSTQQMIAQRAAIIECMSTVMRKDSDFGVIPGTGKPSLYKPSSEKILSMFNLAAKPQVEDLSSPDCIRYRVTITVIHTPTGTIAGYGVGEASSAESKYQWRAAVCDEEWDETPDDRKRLKWKKGYQGSPASSIRQVRADMEDVANTILKMAKKRAQIDAVLTTTAASDVFAQDIEDLIAAGLDLAPDATEFPTSAPLPQELQRKTDAPPAQAQQPTAQHAKPWPAQQSAQTQQSGVRLISGPQASRFWAIAMQYHKDHTKITGYLHNVLGVQKKEDIPLSSYDDAIAWAEGKAED